MQRIREERITRRSVPNESNKLSNNKNSGGDEENKKDDENINRVDEVDKLLEELKANEPTSDNQFSRLAIICYEMGDLSRSMVYAARFKDSNKALFRDGLKDKNVILSEGKLAMADLLTQLYLLCISMDWDFHELRKLGAEHLAERHQDFKRDRWSEIK